MELGWHWTKSNNVNIVDRVHPLRSMNVLTNLQSAQHCRLGAIGWKEHIITSGAKTV